ncbi:MAG: flagellar basal body-associated FliL family protein [Planctomycetales bacterium]|nr:flagellar basal body-associated FliL family protein [Planctomycetales bacterium]
MNVKKLALLGGVGLASAAAGVAVPQMLGGGAAKVAAESTTGDAAHGDAAAHDKPAAAKKEAKKPAAKPDDHGKKDDGHGAAGHGDPKGGDAVPHEGPYFVPFGRIVANINEPLLAKYLSLEITVQTDAENEAEVKEAIELRKPILMTWLAAHIADKTPEDIRGKVGVNRLRREIQDNFNSLLFTDGRERLQDILFEEFHYQ